jgi:hypothetical protein
MEIRYSSDTWEDSGLEPLFAELNISRFFNVRNYGNEEVKLFFVIMCIGENTKPRTRYDSKENVLYWDVILSYSQIKYASIKDRKFLLAKGIIDSFDVIDKYNKTRKLHIDRRKIQEDAKFYFEGLEWM